MWNLLALAMSAFFMILGAWFLAPLVFSMFAVFCFLTILVDKKFFNSEFSGVEDSFYLLCEFIGMLGNLGLLIISWYYS